MRRVYWTADFSEATIVAGLLRANGIDAYVFDAGMAQLNWMETLAIGGYRIMVADADAQTAQDLLVAYRNGGLDLPEGDVDRPKCPNCGADRNDENRRRRGAVLFLSWLGLGLFILTVLFFAFVRLAPLALTLAPQVFFIFCIVFTAVAYLFLLRWSKRRHHCASCAGTWQARSSEFETLSRAVDAAQTADDSRR